MTWRRAARWLAWAPVGLVLAGALLVLGALAALRSERGNEWILARALPLVQPAAGEVRVGRLRTDLLSRLELTDVAVVDPSGRNVVVASGVSAALSPLSLLGASLPVHDVQVVGLDVDLRGGDFDQMWPGDPAAPPWGGLPFEVAVAQFAVEGRVRAADVALEHARATGAVTVRGRVVTWTRLEVAGRTAAGPAALGSSGSWTPGFLFVDATTISVGTALLASTRGSLRGDDLAFAVDPLAVELAALGPLVPALAEVPVVGVISGTAGLAGTLDAPTAQFHLLTAGGPVDGQAGVKLGEPLAWSLVASSPSLRVGDVVGGVEPVRFSGRVAATGTGTSWPAALDAEVSVDALVEARGERASVDGDVVVSAGKLHTEGMSVNLGWARARATGDFDAVALDAGIDVVSSRVDLGRFGAAGSTSFTGRLEGAFAGAPTGSAVGTLSAQNLSYQDLTLDAGAGPIDLTWDGQRAWGTANLALTELRWQGRGAARGNVSLSLGDDYRVVATLDEPRGRVLDLAATADTALTSFVVDKLAVELAPALRLEGRGTQRLTWLGHGVAGVELDLDVAGARLVADGGFGELRRDTMVLAVSALDLATLAPVFGDAFRGYAGTVDARLGLVGTLDDVVVEGSVEGHALVVPGALRGAELVVALEGDGNQLAVEGTLGSDEHNRLRFSAAAPVRVSRDGVAIRDDGPLRAEVVLAPVQVRELNAFLDGISLPEAEASLALTLDGTVLEPRGALVASLGLPLGDGGPVVRSWLDATLAGGALLARGVVNQAFQSRVELFAAVPFDLPRLVQWLRGRDVRPELDDLVGQLAGTIILKQLPVETMRRLARVDWDVHGDVAGAFALSGRPWATKLQGGVNVIAARVGDIPVSRATLELGPSALGYKLDLALGFGTARPLARDTGFARAEAEAEAVEVPDCIDGEGSGELRVLGYVPLGDNFELDRPGLSLEVGGAGVPVAALEAVGVGVAEASGCALAKGTVTGTLAEPVVNVGFLVRDAALTLASLGLRAEGLGLRGRVQPGLLAIDEISASTRPSFASSDLRELGLGTGKIEANAKVRLDGFSPREVEGHLELDRAWLAATADRRVQASGALDLLGPLDALAVTGNVKVDRAYVHLRERFFESGRGTSLHPDIAVTRGHGARVAERLAAAAFPVTVLPRLDLDLARNVRVEVAMPMQGSYGELARSLSTVMVETELDGQLHLDHDDAGVLRLTGEVVPERGVAEVLGRPFEIVEGVVAFTGADYRAPVLALKAVYRTGEYGDIEVEIGGVATAPQLSFGSDEVPQDLALEILVLGKPIADLDDGGGDGTTQALALVAAMLRNEVQEGVAATLRIDRVDVTDGMLGLGFALGPRVFLSTEYNYVPPEGGDNVLAVALEVSLPYRWFLELGTGDQYVSRVSAYRKWRF